MDVFLLTDVLMDMCNIQSCTIQITNSNDEANVLD